MFKIFKKKNTIDSNLYNLMLKMESYQKQLDEQQLRTAWRILRDKYYSGAYQVYGSLPKIKSVDRFLLDLEKKFKIVGESFKRKLLRLITVI